MKKHLPFAIFLLFLYLFFACSSDEQVEEPDTTPPTVSLKIAGLSTTQNDNNSNETPVVSQQITVEIEAEDAAGIAKVEAFIDAEKVGEDVTPPFKIIIDLSNYQSKGIRLNKTQTLYTLAVTATDLSGNSTTKEQQIIVDNEKPVISEVSISSGTVMKGNINPVSFKATDNQDITSVEVLLNRTPVETSLDSLTYSLNIDTNVLEDGANVLVITAKDEAQNITEHTIEFIADNTGPEISVSGIQNAENYDAEIHLEFTANDTYSAIDSLKIYVHDSIVAEEIATGSLNLTINPDEYPTGSQMIKFEATDTLGNKSSSSMEVIFLRRLIDINIEGNSISSEISGGMIFASAQDGSLLASMEIDQSTQEVRLSTLADIAPDQDFMISFAYYYTGYSPSSYLSTIQNITRTTPGIMNIKTPERTTQVRFEEYPMTNVVGNISMISEGPEYNANFDPAAPGSLTFEVKDIVNYDLFPSSKVYISSLNFDNNNYSYLFLDAPLSADLIIDYADFSSNGIEDRFYNADFSQPDTGKHAYLKLYGYVNEEEYLNDAGHLIWSGGRGIQSSFDYSSGILYSFNSNFYNYSYEITLEDFFTRRNGEPLNHYPYPDWTIDYVYSGGSLSLIKGGSGYNVGNAYFENNDQSSEVYRWKFVFDAQKTDELIIPELPEELNTWNIHNHVINGTLEPLQVELKSYEGISDYSTYLKNSVKENLSSKETSSRMDVIFKNKYNTYKHIEDLFLID